MRKRKPTGDALEDYVWSMQAAMGFDEMNKGRNFQIPVGPSTPKQIDVFAKDELSALVVSCKERAEWGARSMQSELESINGLKRYITKEIRSRYGEDPPHFVGFFLATRNIKWSEQDEKRAEGFGIQILRDEELDYFSKLTQLIGSAARYQLMGQLFAGRD
jgi:DNA sulfur modification protein DndB